jgi:hypothetical protein
VPESLVEQAVAAIKADLEAIAGDNGTNYWYTPEAVVRVDEYRSAHLKERYDTIYLLRETGPERTIPGAAFGEVDAIVEQYVLMARRDGRNADERDPFDASTLSGTIRNRMIRDVVKKLESDYTLGGLVFNVEYKSVERDFQEPEGWIVAEVAFDVTYSHSRETP